MTMEVHKQLTEIRAAEYKYLFGDKPIAVYPYHLFAKSDLQIIIDVFVYALDVEGQEDPVVAAVTNGMSDRRLSDERVPEERTRFELIQYFRICAQEKARYLHDMAWLPRFDHFRVDFGHTISWPTPIVENTPWKNAFFLRPIIKPHERFQFDLEGDKTELLWLIPLSDEELTFKKQHGVDALLDKMQEQNLPWIFDAEERISLM